MTCGLLPWLAFFRRLAAAQVLEAHQHGKRPLELAVETRIHGVVESTR
jgi:hypothetical protein